MRWWPMIAKCTGGSEGSVARNEERVKRGQAPRRGIEEQFCHWRSGE